MFPCLIALLCHHHDFINDDIDCIQAPVQIIVLQIIKEKVVQRLFNISMDNHIISPITFCVLYNYRFDIQSQLPQGIRNIDLCCPSGFFYAGTNSTVEGYPVCQYDDDGVEAFIKDAIKNVKPLCANCHCMVHRNKKNAISVNELKKLIK